MILCWYTYTFDSYVLNWNRHMFSKTPNTITHLTATKPSIYIKGNFLSSPAVTSSFTMVLLLTRDMLFKDYSFDVLQWASPFDFFYTGWPRFFWVSLGFSHRTPSDLTKSDQHLCNGFDFP